MEVIVPETPTLLEVRLVCPDCSQALQVSMEVTSVLTTTTDMDGEDLKELAPHIKKQKIAHHCGQRTLDDVVIDGRVVDVATGKVRP